jgi:beta-lactamase regulating signal transducer with metallopeptidase domain
MNPIAGPLSQAALAIGGSAELLLVAKVTLIFAAGLAVTRLSAGASASIRHVVLTCTFGGALLLAPATASMPAWGVAVAQPALAASSTVPPVATRATRTVQSQAAAQRATPVTTSLEPAVTARAVWLAGILGSGILMAAGLCNLRWIRRTAIPALPLQREADALAKACGVRRPVAVVTHEHVVTPLTFGLRRPLIALPPDAAAWSAEAARRALVHELEHVRRFDWAWHVGARLTCALFWFHPLAWVAWRQLRLEAERACDDAVVRTSDGVDYAEQLVSLARRISGRSPRTSLAMAARSDLSTRVAALLDPHQLRSGAGGVPLCTAAFVSLALVLTIAPVRARAVTGPDSLRLDGAQREGQGTRGRSLYHAARRGDVEWMATLIDGGADVNAAIDGDGSPLIAAARAGHLAAVTLLLDRGADVNLAVEGDGNPLIMAAREGHRDIVALLLDRGARIDHVVPSDETALIQASGSGHVEVVTLLLARGADVNLRVWADQSGPQSAGEWRSALSMAQRGGHTAVVRLLVAAGAVR